MKFDSQGSSRIFRPCQEKAGGEPSLWAAALDTGSVWSLDSGTPGWIALLSGRGCSSENNHQDFSDLHRFPQIPARCGFVGSAVCAAQHSQIWINHPVERLGDLGLGFGLGPKTSCAHFQQKRASFDFTFPVCAVVPSPQSMTATDQNDSSCPVEVIIWH